MFPWVFEDAFIVIPGATYYFKPALHNFEHTLNWIYDYR